MKVLTVKPFEEACAAELCLRLEDIEPDVRVVTPYRPADRETVNYGMHPEQYASHFVEMWQAGKEFINVEYDIAPWPGSIREMHHCTSALCCYRYLYPSNVPQRLSNGFGCMKFGQSVLDYIPVSWENWGAVSWWDLDGAILSDIKEAGFTVHEHFPFVAHVKQPVN